MLILADTTGLTIGIYARAADGSAKTGVASGDVTGYYLREGGSPQSVSMSTWTEASSADMPGYYELTLPDSALASGVKYTDFVFSAAGMLPITLRLELVGFDPQSALNTESNFNDGVNYLDDMISSVNSNVSLVHGDTTAIKANTEAITVQIAALDIVGDGTGDIDFTYTVNVDGSPREGAWVGVYSDSGRTTLVAQGTTNSLGQVVFHLAAATYYLKIEAPGIPMAYDEEEVA